MARFSFRLQPYLNIKEQLEDQKEIEYGRAMRKLEEERERKRQLELQREAEINAFRAAVQAAIKPVYLRRYNNAIEYIKRRIAEQEKRIASAEAFAERKRLELVEAMKERKAMETIKENAFELYNREETLTEQKQVDELVSYKYATQKTGL